MSSPATLQQASGVEDFSDPKKGNGRRLTQREISRCLALADEGRSGVEIAEVLRCSEATVSRTLDQWADSRPLARRYLEAQATKLAKTVTQSKDAAVALKALGKLDVVREDAISSGNSMVVVLGNEAKPLEPPSILGSLSPVQKQLEGEGA